VIVIVGWLTCKPVPRFCPNASPPPLPAFFGMVAWQHGSELVVEPTF